MIKIGSALLEHVEQLERERGIPRDVTLSSLQEAMVAAYKRYAHLQETKGIICKLIEKSGEIGIYEVKNVVKKIDPDNEEHEMAITLKDAKKIKADVEEGDVLEIEVTPDPDQFGRIAAQSAKQVITQRIREAEKLLIQKEFEEKQGQVTTGIVQRIEGRNVVVNIGKSEAVLPPREQLPGEYYRVGNRLRVFVADLRDSGRVPQIIVSQAHPAMVREVFELEVPEIEDGLVELKNIAREAGYRTKVSVVSHDPEVDAQGACIGARGSRIQAIANELKNEKIDVIKWSDNPMEYITNALAPAKIVNVHVDDENPNHPRALVVVPDDQLSLAIGREGQNVRLAAKLTGYKIDIKSLSQIQAEVVAQDRSGDAAEDAEEAEAPVAETTEIPVSEASESFEAEASADTAEEAPASEESEQEPQQA